MPLWYDFISLFFPRICESCGNSLLKHEYCICNFCLHHLPRTDFHSFRNNPVARLFWGRVRIEYAASFFYFHKGSRVQQMIHGIKYKGKTRLGFFLGRKYGELLKDCEGFQDIQLVIPVPLHPAKKRKRGYNQSELIARGIAEGLGKGVDTVHLLRKTATETQTRKSRFRRWENVKEVFVLKDPAFFSGKHVLLADDVVTTGATLEACVTCLQQSPGISVSIVTLACAVR